MNDGRTSSALTAHGFDHVDLYVGDLASSARFFTDKLGLEVLSESDDHVFLILGDQVLGLRRANGGARASVPHHVAIRVSGFDGLRQEVEARGLVVRDERERADSRSIFVDGPEGIAIELIHRPHPKPPACATNGVSR